MRAILGTTVLGAIMGALTLAQQPSPAQFRSGTDLVQVDVSVLDGKRQPVVGLTAADFTIFENGQPRPVEAFTSIELPDRVTTVDATWTRDVPPDVATNAVGADEGRIVVILMDRTIPIGQPTQTARQVAAAAVEALGPGDLAALVSTSGGIPQNLTADRARLIRAINQRDWSAGASAETREIDQTMGTRMVEMSQEAGGGGFDPSAVFTPLTDPRCLCGLCAHQTITNVATALEAMPRRRKSLLFIGSNFIIQAGPQVQQAEIGCAQKLEDSRKVMFAALDRSGVTVHSIDPTGLQVVGPTSQASSTVRGAATRGAFATAVQENLANQGTLGVLPDRTGGRVVANTNGPEARVPEIVRESQSYYVLGFRPAEPSVPGQARSIEVKVNRRDVKVSTRRGYVVPASVSAPDATATLRAAMSSTLPSAAVPLGLNAAAFAVPGSERSAVAVSVDVSGFAPAAAETGAAVATVPLELAVAAYDMSGQPRASARQTLTLSWPTGEGRARKVELLSRLDVPPGEYEIRAAVTGDATSRPASVFTYLTVPPFAAAPLSLSNIVMAAAPTTSSAPRDFLAAVLPVVPTTTREFGRTDAAVAFFRIYQGTARGEAIAPVDLRARVLNASNQAAISQALVFRPVEFEKNRTADGRINLPISRLPPGEYLLSLEAAMGERVAGRALRFRVR